MRALLDPPAPGEIGRRMLEPFARIVHHPGDQSTPCRCDGSENGNAQNDRLPDGDERCMRVHDDQRIGACGRMYRFRHEHEDQRQNECENVNPERISKELEAERSDQDAAQVTSEEGARLRRGCAGETEQKDRRAAKRGQKERREGGSTKLRIRLSASAAPVAAEKSRRTFLESWRAVRRGAESRRVIFESRSLNASPVARAVGQQSAFKALFCLFQRRLSSNAVVC